MPDHNCRLCGLPLTSDAIFALERAPAGAQLFYKYGDANAAIGSSQIRLAVMQCSSCGLVQLNNDCIVPYYRSTITAAGLSPEMKEFRHQQFQSFAEEFGLTGKKIMEVGASKGMFTDLLADLNMNACGIEGAAPIEGTHTPGGRSLLKGYPARGETLPGGPYAGFICINFLEHAPDPVGFLNGIALSLEPGAPGIVEVPAFEQMTEANLSYDWIADHLNYFNKDSLRLILELSGFEIIRIDRVWHNYDLAATVRRRAPLSLIAMRDDYDRAVRNLKEFVAIGRTKGRVAIWGASHQALTLLTDCAFSTTDIDAIIDSATFKQYHFAPGCGLPVVPPTWLSQHDIQVVLIMAGGYSEEVSRQLRHTLSYKGEIAIFQGSNPVKLVT